MKNDVLYATGMFDIGDKFYDDHGQLRTVTDILVCHFLGSGTFKVRYQIDGSQDYIDLRLRGFNEMSEDETRKQDKPVLHLAHSPKNDPFGFNSGGE